MHSGKRLTKEDTWRPADLRRYIREGQGEERRYRGGESIERRHRETETKSQREREKQRESTRERGDEDDQYIDRRKESSRDRRGDREKRDELDREKRERDRLVAGKRYHDTKESGDRRHHTEEKHERERDKERHREKERERKKEERDSERKREHRTERERRHKESGAGDWMGKHERERRERHREREHDGGEYKDRRNGKERRETHGVWKYLEEMEGGGHKDERRKHKEEKERSHKQRGYHDEKRRKDSVSEGQRPRKAPGEEVRHHRSSRERPEQDDRKERRRREEEEEVRRHQDRDRNTSKKLTERSHTQEAKTEDAAVVSDHRSVSVKDAADAEEPVENDDRADEEYEDDFLEYEEGEMDESEGEGEEKEEPESQWKKEIEAVQRAMDEENKRVGTAGSRRRSREEDEESKSSRGSEKKQSGSSQRGKFINFVAAKQREISQKVATKQKKRSTELLRLIDLDFSMTFSILDLPPVNEYDMYIRNFGTANTRQAYVQCNEDNAERDIQTEEIETCEKWTQHPPEHGGACGDPNLPWEARDKTTRESNFDSQRLTAFLRSASQVMTLLLEEDRAERESLKRHGSHTDRLSFSDGSLQLNTKFPFLHGRSISLVHFSQVQRHTMMTVHSPTTKPGNVHLNSCSLICIWNIWEPSRPQKVLIYESEVRCCSFSPGKAALVFAGTSVGSVVLWDLREQPSNHYHLKTGRDEWTFRQPTFSTDAVMPGSGHLSCVTSVEVIPSTLAGGLKSEVPLLASEEESSGLSFQLASLDESGGLNFWVVVELQKANEAGSPTDLGLRPGGKVKLLHSSFLLTAERSPRDAVKTGLLQTLHLKFLPTDPNHFFIGTNMGLVNHGTSHGLKATPRFYRCQEAGVRPVEVTSIDFSPFVQHLFLVGCGDGTVRLHAVSHEKPVAEWRNSGAPVVLLQWTQTRPTVFCVLDAASNLHIWDLLTNTTQPVITERITSDRVTAMAVFGDSGQPHTYSGVALAHESGTTEIQYFTRGFTTPMTAEEEKLESMMNEAF